MSKKTGKKRSFSPEYKAHVVRLCEEPGKTIAEVARDLGVARSVIAQWVKQAAVNRGSGEAGALTSEERAELRALRKENKRLKQEREILRHATAFFAREGTT